MLSPYTAINASAGSGKTHSLVQNILMICLRYPKQETAVRHILALTFTNKAANEMKERILSWLKEFTREDYATNDKLLGIRDEFKRMGINLSVEELHGRAQKVLDYILHHYSTLNIGTIDKFNARLVRSFSYELGLAHQFNLEIQSEPYLIEAVDKMLDSIGEDAEISDSFMDFVNYNLDNDERIFLNKTLYKTAKQFLNDVHYDELKKNENFHWEVYENTKKQLREEIKTHRGAAEEIAQKALKQIEDNGLSVPDFAKGENGIGGFFKKFINKKSPLIYDSADIENDRVEGFLKGASTSGKKRQPEIEAILPDLLQARKDLIFNFIEAEKKSKILKELLPLKINREIQEKLSQIEEENDLVLLSKFNILISENLKNEPSSFIYEKIGTQYQHYFFDEFQDTSKMQWENILPLRDHTINTANSSFTLVGDPKQSIYRFRGGDSELMLNILNKTEYTNVEVEIKNLDRNWRSATNIVSFNNGLYTAISKTLLPQHAELFSEKAIQIPQQSFEGRVKINLTAYDKKSDVFFENAAEQMHKDIRDCIAAGFSLADITILCRTAKDIQKFSRLLGGKKIMYRDEEIFIPTISERGLTLDLSYTLLALMEFLNWEAAPKNRQFLVKMMYFLTETERIKTEDFSAEMMEILQYSDAEIKAHILQHYGLNLSQGSQPNLNLYNYIEHFLQEFSVENKETDFLLTFLETAYNFTQNAGKSVKDFIKFWEEDAHGISIQASENTDAIKLMTIHSAKGLEFPVVFLPMLNGNKDSKVSAWYELEEMDALKSVNISNFDKQFGAYDEKIKLFNENNTYRNLIDRLCLLYVATTRPVEQLYLYIQEPSAPDKNHLEIYDYVLTKQPDDQKEFDFYPAENIIHLKHSVKEKPSTKPQPISIGKETEMPKSAIKIATPSKNYQSTKEQVRTGIFTHEILSKINSGKDIDKVLESYLLEGAITTSERDEIKIRLQKIIEDDRFKEYFREGLTVLNEKDIMLTENGISEIYRPDRLIDTGDGYIILDFKTGAEREKHATQIETYKTVLEKLGRKVIKTEVLYL